MPTITELNLIDITPRAFLDSCSPGELLEVAGLMQRAEYQDKVHEAMSWRISYLLLLLELDYVAECCDLQVTEDLLTALDYEKIIQN